MESSPRLYRNFLGAVVGVLAVCGLMMNLPVLGVLAFVFLVLLAYGNLSCRAGLADLECKRSFYRSAFEDDAVEVDLRISNSGRRTLELFEVTDHFTAALAESQVIREVEPLPREQRVERSYKARCSRRWGVYTVGPITVSRWDRFGLFNGTRRYLEFAEFAVFPKAHPVADLRWAQGSSSFAALDRTRSQPGQSSLYMGVQDYRPGDDPRRLHWPMTARRGELTVKLFETDVRPSLAVVVDLQNEYRSGTGPQVLTGVHRSCRDLVCCTKRHKRALRSNSSLRTRNRCMCHLG